MTQSNGDITTEQIEAKLGIEITGKGNPYTKKSIPNSWERAFAAKADMYGDTQNELWKHPDGYYVHTTENIDGLHYIRQFGKTIDFEAVIDHEIARQHDVEPEALEATVVDCFVQSIVDQLGVYDAFWSSDTISLSIVLDGFSDEETEVMGESADRHDMSARLVLSDD